MQLDEVLALLTAMPPDDKKRAKADAWAATANMKFVPNPGPQTEAFFCDADELFYGGAAGGGKSFLLASIAIHNHERSLLFRREYTQLRGLVDEVAKVLGTRDGYNGQDKIWKLPNGKVLEFGSVQHEDDKEKYQGRAHDLKGFDEITHFSESQYRFLIAWNRSTTPGQRCRVIATGNPPWTAGGQWVRKYWAPWLDPLHPNPAKHGELRWFTTVDGEDVEVGNRGPHLIDGREVFAQSRTFIGAKLEDTPQLAETGYASRLEAMEEPVRTMMREGSFDIGLKDADFQVIPTAWIVAAQNRWTEDGGKAFTVTAMAFDPAGGGKDAAELCWRQGGWYAPLVTEKGEMTADGSRAAGLIASKRRDNAPVVVDVGGGYGGAVTLRLKDNGIAFVPFNGANAAMGRTKDGNLKFANKRAEAWWRFREELDPDQEGGSAICLPPDPELRSDLAAPTYEVGARGIQIEAKESLRERLGRSPGKGDVVVMCLSEGNAAVKRNLHRSAQLPQQATVGYAHMKRKR